jgi:hypothetical protein
MNDQIQYEKVNDNNNLNMKKVVKKKKYRPRETVKINKRRNTQRCSSVL